MADEPRTLEELVSMREEELWSAICAFDQDSSHEGFQLKQSIAALIDAKVALALHKAGISPVQRSQD